MDNRYATVTLNLIPGTGALRIQQLLSVFGEAKEVLQADRDALSRVHGIGPKLAEKIVSWKENTDTDEELRRTERAGVELVLKEDSVYPPLLREIADPPLCLYVKGDPGVLKHSESSVAVVGSRRTTFYGCRTAERLSSGVAQAGWTVVSGLARGIDATAQDAALAASGRTLAVLGSGLGRIYPQENVTLAHQIEEQGGALVSEFPMLFPPDRRSFPMRNRIISGVSKGTLVVEAGDKSGSLITANLALEQGRQVLAVPGRIDTPQASGCNQLIKEGAKLVENTGDIFEELADNPLPASKPNAGEAATSEEEQQTANKKGLQLSELENNILQLVSDNGGLDIDTLIAYLDMPSQQVVTTLVGMEMKRLVRQLPGRRVVPADRNLSE